MSSKNKIEQPKIPQNLTLANFQDLYYKDNNNRSERSIKPFVIGRKNILRLPCFLLFLVFNKV
jgi:hypothetical protein